MRLVNALFGWGNLARPYAPRIARRHALRGAYCCFARAVYSSRYYIHESAVRVLHARVVVADVEISKSQPYITHAVSVSAGLLLQQGEAVIAVAVCRQLPWRHTYYCGKDRFFGESERPQTGSRRVESQSETGGGKDGRGTS